MSGETLLEVRHLHVTYRQGHTDLPALRDISLTLSRGEAYGIIGESGSGKSTLAYAIMRHLGTNGRIESGAIRPVVGARFPLEQAADAMRLIDERRATGKVVLDVSEEGAAP